MTTDPTNRGLAADSPCVVSAPVIAVSIRNQHRWTFQPNLKLYERLLVSVHYVRRMKRLHVKTRMHGINGSFWAHQQTASYRKSTKCTRISTY